MSYLEAGLVAYRETIFSAKSYDDLDEIPAAVPEDRLLAVLKVRYSG